MIIEDNPFKVFIGGQEKLDVDDPLPPEQQKLYEKAKAALVLAINELVDVLKEKKKKDQVPLKILNELARIAQVEVPKENLPLYELLGDWSNDLKWLLKHILLNLLPASTLIPEIAPEVDKKFHIEHFTYQSVEQCDSLSQKLMADLDIRKRLLKLLVDEEVVGEEDILQFYKENEPQETFLLDLFEFQKYLSELPGREALERIKHGFNEIYKKALANRRILERLKRKQKYKNHQRLNNILTRTITKIDEKRIEEEFTKIIDGELSNMDYDDLLANLIFRVSASNSTMAIQLKSMIEVALLFLLENTDEQQVTPLGTKRPKLLVNRDEGISGFHVYDATGTGDTKKLEQEALQLLREYLLEIWKTNINLNDCLKILRNAGIKEQPDPTDTDDLTPPAELVERLIMTTPRDEELFEVIHNTDFPFRLIKNPHYSPTHDKFFVDTYRVIQFLLEGKKVNQTDANQIALELTRIIKLSTEAKIWSIHVQADVSRQANKIKKLLLEKFRSKGQNVLVN